MIVDLNPMEWDIVLGAIAVAVSAANEHELPKNGIAVIAAVGLRIMQQVDGMTASEPDSLQ